MSISIDELQMETQPAASASEQPPGSAAAKPKRELRAELDFLHEREDRLKAD